MAKGTPPAGGFTRLGLTGTTAVPYSSFAGKAATSTYWSNTRLVATPRTRLAAIPSVALKPVPTDTLRRTS